MKLGLVGDIHAERDLPAQRVDQVLFVSDVVDGKGDVDRCCAIFDVEGARVGFFDLEDPSAPRPEEEIAIPHG